MSVTIPRPVAGSTLLPVGFTHPHASEEARAIAEQGMIFELVANAYRFVSRWPPAGSR